MNNPSRPLALIAFCLLLSSCGKAPPEKAKKRPVPSVKVEAVTPRVFTRTLQRSYGRQISGALRHRFITLLLFVAVAAGGLINFKKAGTEFMPKVDDGRIMVKVRMPAGAALERLDEINRGIEALVAGKPSAERVD